MNLKSAKAREELRKEFGAPHACRPNLRKYEEKRGRHLAEICRTVMAQTGVRVSDVVQDSGHGVCIITGHDLQFLYQRRLPTGGRMSRSFSSINNGEHTLVILFRPPETHIHPFAVYPPRGSVEGGEEFYARAKRLQAYIAKHIQPVDCIEHDGCGVFWARTAVARLMEIFQGLES